MLIDPYQTNWQSELLDRYRQLPAGARLVLLIDGVFLPGLFRQVGIASRSVLLFEWLPGCSDDVRDVSPFLVQRPDAGPYEYFCEHTLHQVFLHI